jgi:hypothetical protein
MKITITLFLIFFSVLPSHAIEIHLLCKGTETQQQNDSKIEVVERIYEVTFDDTKNQVTGFTKKLSSGCFKTEDHILSTKCQCDVTSDEISCSSEVIGIKFPDWKREDSFRINRKTGRMRAYEYSGNTKNSFKFIGELNCEKFEKNKF